jgi:hypothetical protein
MIYQEDGSRKQAGVAIFIYDKKPKLIRTKNVRCNDYKYTV